MSNGWIKLHRRLLESPLFSSDKGLKVWIWCLLKASHEEKALYVGLNQIKLRPGQFVFGRDKSSKELAMKPSTVRNWMGVLKQDSYIDITKTNKYSVVTVLNWTLYQSRDSTLDNRWTTDGQQMDTNKNVKNDKNTDNGKIASPCSFETARDAIAQQLSFKRSGISTAWQDKAFRYADYLGIDLKDHALKGRWLKFFKDCHQNVAIDSSVSYLKDYDPFVNLPSADAKMRYFFGYFYNSSKASVIALIFACIFVCVSHINFAATVTKRVEIQPKLAIARPLVKKAQVRSQSSETKNSDRRESKPDQGEPFQASHTVTSKNVTPAQAISITPFKKYLTDDANRVRNSLLPQIYSDYGPDDALALDNILKKEAGYRPDAINEIGAGGMPQALPYSKMGCDLAWTDEAVQCQYQWMKTYIANRYGTPSKAWDFHLVNNYY